MSIVLRPPTPADVPAIGKLVFDAFASIHDRHPFPRDFPVIDAAHGFAQAWVGHAGVWGVLAERDGRIIGCNFLDQRNVVPGVGPICVDPAAQAGGVGRRLMQAVIDHGRQSGATSIRLVQDAFNTASMSLYASLGFVVNEPLVLVQGKPAAQRSGGAVVRSMTEADLRACGELCQAVHGFDRNGELADALKMPATPFVLERGGRITAYASAPTFWLLNHGVARTADDMLDLLRGAASQSDKPLSLLVPTRNAPFFRWCLEQRLRVIKPMTLMTWGEYREPQGWWYPSVEY